MPTASALASIGASAKPLDAGADQGGDEGATNVRMDDADGDDLVLVSSAAVLTPEQSAAATACHEGSEAVVRVARPATVTIDEAENVSEHILCQWARIRSAEAMDAARAIADRGQYKEGKQVIDTALKEVTKTMGQVKLHKQRRKAADMANAAAAAPAAAAPAAATDDHDDEEDALLSNLVEQLQECQSDMQQSSLNRHHWQSKAKYTMAAYAQTHHAQRSNCSKMELMDGVMEVNETMRNQTMKKKSAYRSKAKKAMCSNSYQSPALESARMKIANSASHSVRIPQRKQAKKSTHSAPPPPPMTGTFYSSNSSQGTGGTGVLSSIMNSMRANLGSKPDSSTILPK